MHFPISFTDLPDDREKPPNHSFYKHVKGPIFEASQDWVFVPLGCLLQRENSSWRVEEYVDVRDKT